VFSYGLNDLGIAGLMKSVFLMAATAATSAEKIYRRWRYFGDIFKNRMSKSDCNIHIFLS